MAWTIAKGIKTPKGDYVPKTDDLVSELKAAAVFAGLEAFNVKIDGLYIESEAQLPCASFAALTKDVTVEDARGATAPVETIEVEARDTAGC